MKRGVPPTARNARTGELTPPGITRWARANSASLVVGTSVDTARRSLGLGLGTFGGRRGRGGFVLAVLGRRRRPEEAVRDDVAHPGAESRVQALVHERQRLADRCLQFGARGQQRGQRGGEGVAGADERGLEHLELLARDRALRRREY